MEVAPPLFNGVFNTCVDHGTLRPQNGSGEKEFSWQGSFSDITPKLRSPRAWVRFHSVAISQHIARGRVALLGLCSRDSRIRSAARCHFLRLSHFPDPGAPMMPDVVEIPLQLASMDVLESIDRADAFVNADEGYPSHIRDSAPPPFKPPYPQ